MDSNRLKKGGKFGRLEQALKKAPYRHDVRMEEFKRMAANPVEMKKSQ